MVSLCWENAPTRLCGRPRLDHVARDLQGGELLALVQVVDALQAILRVFSGRRHKGQRRRPRRPQPTRLAHLVQVEAAQIDLVVEALDFGEAVPFQPQRPKPGPVLKALRDA